MVVNGKVGLIALPHRAASHTSWRRGCLRGVFFVVRQQGRGCRRPRGLRLFHPATALEDGALVDHQLRRRHVAAELAARLDLDRVLGGDVAGDDDATYRDLCVDASALARVVPRSV